MSRVAVEELRAEFEASGLTAAELARRLGWGRAGKSWPDTQRVLRVLGYRLQDNSRGYGTGLRRSVNAETAARVRAALARGG